MGRHLVIAAAQMGPIARTESRAAVVRRMIDLMRQAKALGDTMSKVRLLVMLQLVK